MNNERQKSQAPNLDLLFCTRYPDWDKEGLINEASFQLSFLDTPSFHNVIQALPRHHLERVILEGSSAAMIKQLLKKIKEEKRRKGI